MLLEIRFPPRSVPGIHILDRVGVAIDGGLLPRAEERGNIFNLWLRHLGERRHLSTAIMNYRSDLVALLIVERQSGANQIRPTLAATIRIRAVAESAIRDEKLLPSIYCGGVWNVPADQKAAPAAAAAPALLLRACGRWNIGLCR